MTNYNNGGYGNNGGEQRGNSGFDSFAQIQVIGRLTRDPESKQVGNSTVASVDIAVNHGNNKTDFWEVQAWINGQNSTNHDYLVQYLKKGSKVFISGVPQLNYKKNDDGGGRHFPAINVLQIRGLDPRGQDGGQAQGGFQPQQQQQPAQGGFQPPQGGFQPQQQGGFQPPQQPQQPQQQGGFQPPQQGGFPQPQGAPQAGAPQGGFQPPQGGFQPPQGAPAQPVTNFGAPAGAPYNG